MLILGHSMCFWLRRKALSKWPWCMGKVYITCGLGWEGIFREIQLVSGNEKNRIL